MARTSLTGSITFALLAFRADAQSRSGAGAGWETGTLLSQWRTCATTEDRLTRHPDVPFEAPPADGSSSFCVYAELCPASCSMPGGACSAVCGPPYTGGACACSSAPGCGTSCQGCPECSSCCCRAAKHLLEVDSGQAFQTIQGFGGAFTEAAALNFFSLSDADQAFVLDAYFGAPFGSDGGDGGHGYQLGRIPINSCDFSPAQFSYDNVTDDGPKLPNFDHTVSHDARQVIPFVLKAQARAEQARTIWTDRERIAATSTTPALQLFGSPWSPPAWMKNPGGNRPNLTSMSGSNPTQGLATRHQADWATYLSDWVSAFRARGVNIWGITVQNEAEFAAPWEACVYNASFQAQFIANHLGPIMLRDHPGLIIMAYDHNKDHVALWAEALAANTDAMKYLAGVAFHWYLNGPGCSIGTGDCMEQGAANLDAAYKFLNDGDSAGGGSGAFLLATESCNCPGIADDAPALDEGVGKGWQRGERLMRDQLSDLNHFSVGYVDWNLLVDYKGGPNHLGNYCDANIVADPGKKLTNKTTGAGNDRTVVLRPSYYMLGHVARFAPRGSVRINATFTVAPSNRGADSSMVGRVVDVAAFALPNGSTSVVLLNRGEESLEYVLRDKVTGRAAELTAPAHSAQSFIF